MANYRITCTRLEPAGPREPTPHIVAVGTGASPGRFDTLWAVDEVLHAMDHGHVFYTRGERSGKLARIESVVCPRCYRTFLRTIPDSAPDTKLESLPHCEEYHEWGRDREASFVHGNVEAFVGEGVMQSK